MQNISKTSVFFIFAMALATFQLRGTEASAQSSYFTSRGCVNCHTAPVTATCNGCHHHGNSSLSASTNKTSYAPGEAVTATLSGGTRTGWIRAILYDQNNVQIAVSNGNASGMGGSTTFPAALSAPAPTAAGTYTWKMAYFGNLDGTGTGDVHGEARVNTNSFTVVAAVDATAPVVSAFTLPAAATSLTVTVTSFTATDNVAVTGYLINKTSTAPLASATGWAATAPASVTAVAGSNTFYAWVKDAAGNVSLSKSASVTVTLPDTTPPVTTVSTAGGTYTSAQNVTLTANEPATIYFTTNGATPTSASPIYSGPISIQATITLKYFARDTAGNSETPKTATYTIVAETIIPVVSAFALPATSTSLTVPVTAFTATDNVGVSGYLINKSATAPLASATGWTATAPTSVTAVAGSNTFYAWVKDAAGNVSLAKSASVMVTVRKIISKDFDGDSKSDLGVWDPTNYNWFILNSATNQQKVVNYGTSGDITVPGDYDGDGKTDIAIWRPSNGAWYIQNSATNTQSVVTYGTTGDIPVPGDYDGDGKTDIAIWRPSNGAWYIQNSATGSQSVVNYGTSGDIPVPGDYDGDGKTDLAVWRNGNWFITNSATNTQSVATYGTTGDIPVPGDYDGIGRTETAVWRSAEGNWYILNSVTGTQRVVQLGIPTDQPIK